MKETPITKELVDRNIDLTLHLGPLLLRKLTEICPLVVCKGVCVTPSLRCNVFAVVPLLALALLISGLVEMPLNLKKRLTYMYLLFMSLRDPHNGRTRICLILAICCM